MLSHEHVAHVRDAFAEVLKLQNCQELGVRGSDAYCAVVSHVHDEASMRIRSYIADARDNDSVLVTGPRIARGQSTKVRSAPEASSDSLTESCMCMCGR